ncbi:thiamine pyrophosphate-dependent enzyme (homolog to acetolactate synthase / benzoylformate decarboxylase) [Natronomonas pharaonis DSM 2160]|uniref:Thiamine pyrophosphate-dependent enzyme (Homolog to acetolactate synthase / benzoylformate decarboxylase) n=1 Tax=Natronomonas pharaonis (strain ATCC 35678 / DSM 2160 / CIP 103997 / JCM 8858 / NBRC 14720 / NCIMB 2260 / Gabara) TaxID=348780 RepID=A0A1U7EVI2_NATPD|nr:thiamine pyrophosphate-binding protein [Natronomonas pharaonis]CAI49043.1 thiamine pyrophosphate-dependent enzyme (homolog to acetolactate synthase / benzoylformate decarboxylase) [Natronomonas pharaonis DSM 2160]
MAESDTGAELFVDALESYGVEHIFGNPGTTELPVLDAISESDIEYILGLQEDIATGMAAGYASTRRYHAEDDADICPVGVVNLHVTPGLAHGLGNVFGAMYSGAPVVVTAGNHELDFRHEEPILTGDLEAMVEQFCKFSAEVTHVDSLPMLLRRAVRTALTPPTGPVFLALPADVMMAETDADPEPLGPIPDAGGGDPNQIATAADYFVEADQPVLVLGDHVARAGRDAVEAAVELAEATGARVHGEILASEINFPTDHDQWVSFIGPDESIASMLMDTDTLGLVGCSTNTTLLRHESPLIDADTTTVQVSSDPDEVGKNHPADAAVIGDPGRIMRAIAERVDKRLDDDEQAARIDHVETMKASLEPTMQSLGEDETPPGDTRSSKAELVDTMAAVEEDVFIVDEGVTSKFALLTRFPLDVQGYLSNKGGGLGYGLPAAVGAALAESLRDDPQEVVGYIGDGSYLYYPNSIYSATRYDLDLTVVVPDNRNYRILKDNTVAMMGGDESDYDFVGMDFDPHVDIPKNAESHGARGHLAETPEEFEDIYAEALDSSGTDVIDVLVHD